MSGLFQAVASQLGNLGGGLAEAKDAQTDAINKAKETQFAQAQKVKEFLEQQKMDTLQTQVWQAQEKAREQGTWQPIGNPMPDKNGVYNVIEHNTASGEIRVKPLPADVAPQSEDEIKWDQYRDAYKKAFKAEPSDDIRAAFFNKLAGVPTKDKDEFDQWREAFKVRTGRYPNDQEIAEWHRKPGSAAGAAGDLDAMAQAVADKTTKLPAGKLGVQVANRMKQMGLKLPNQLGTALEDKLEQRADALTQTSYLIDQVIPDLDLIKTLPKATLIELAQSPGTVENVLYRYGGLFMSTKEKARVERLVGNLRSLQESVNTIRGPLGATGFRGREGWQALQSQTVRAMSTPGINAQTLGNTKKLVDSLLGSTQDILGGGDGSGGSSDLDKALDDLLGPKKTN
jgi:hypothetical protein